jgi:mRNA interferase MazF
MGKIQDLYSTQVRPMLPAERLQLARLILDDLAPGEQPVDISDEWTDDDLADASAASARQADRSTKGNGAGNEARCNCLDRFSRRRTNQAPAAVILSSASYHSTRPDVILGLVTSQTVKATAPTDHLLQDWQSAGLRVPSAFRAFLVTLPQSSIVSTMGTLSASDWNEVVTRVKLALNLK